MKSFTSLFKALVVAFILIAPFACEQLQFADNSAVNQPSVEVGKLILFPSVDSLGNKVSIGSANSRVGASAPYVSGFSFPFGADRVYTQTHSDDGWYNAQGLVKGVFIANQWHLGEDWNIESGSNNEQGLPCYAMAEGEVVYSAYEGACWGDVVIVRHNLPDGRQIETLYGHLSKRIVSKGDILGRRQQIGSIGGKGLICNKSAITAHLHLEARYSNCPEWGKPGPGYATSTTGWLAASSLVYNFYPTWPIALNTPANNATIARNKSQLFSWENWWLANGPESRIQVAYSANSTLGFNAQTGFTQGIVLNSNIGRYNGINLSFSAPGTYYWTVRSSNAGYSSGYGLYMSNYATPRKLVVN